MTGLDTALPRWDVQTVHRRHIPADPAAVWHALTEVGLGDLRLARALVAVRYAFGEPRVTDGPLLEHGPLTFVGRDEGRSLLGCGIARSWQRTPERRIPADLADFADFDEPGWLKLASDFEIRPDGTGSVLTTRARVHCTDDAARRRFRVYWLLISVFSRAVRRDLLDGVARRAVG